jgi:hypothetical protein
MAAITHDAPRSPEPMPWLIRLYPASWRERYGEEFMALLQSRPPTRRDRLDIVRGAIDARIHPQRLHELPPRVASGVDRLLALAAVAVGALLTVWAGIIIVAEPRWGTGSQLDDGLIAASYSAGFIGIVIAMAVLVGIAYRYADELGRAGVVGALVAAAAFLMILGQASALGVLLLPLGTLMLGSGLVRVIPWPIVTVFVGATAAMTASMLGFVGSQGQQVVWLSLGLAFGPSWVLLGIFLRRGPRAGRVALAGA